MAAASGLICGIGATVLAGFSAAGITNAVLERLRRGRIVSGNNGSDQGVSARLVRNGIGVLMPLARLLRRQSFVRRSVDEALAYLEMRCVLATPDALLSVVLAFVLVCFAGLMFATRSVVCAIAMPLCVLVIAVAFLNAAQDKRQEATREAVPDALRAMGVCFQSGLSLLQTFRQVSSEVKAPLSDLFSRAAHRLETGRSVEEALAVFKESSASSELAFVAVALNVQHEAGGSMRQVLDAARETVESEIELARSLRVQTAQAKLSARVVSVMPFALIALFSVISEGFLEPFFSSVAGFALLGLALGLQLAGILLVRRMLAVEVC